MSSHIEAGAALADPATPAHNRDWAAHCNALRTPELRSALEQLHTLLESFLNDAKQP